MSGTVKQAKLETRTSRARLERKREPHWRALIVGRAHLGWQRKPDARDAGKWILRRFIDGKYTICTLGLADDLAAADGEIVLRLEEAEARARAMFGRQAGMHKRW